MASMYLYAIKDIVAKEFGPVFQAKNDQVAVRQVNNTFKTMPPGEAEEFHLYRLGEFDQETGIILRSNQLEPIKWYFAPMNLKEE